MRIALLCALALAAGAAQAQSLREAVDAAWALNPQARLLDARQAEFEARAAVAQSWTAEPPALAVGSRNDRLNRNQGDQEFELELDLPLWLPGERDARIALAGRELEQLAGQRAALRLELAGAVREAWLALSLTRREAAVAETRLDTDRRLEADVKRRLALGDVSRLDANLAEAERIAAESARAEARARALDARRALLALTGLAVEADLPDEPVATAAGESAALTAARNAVAVAEARLTAAALATRANPELSVAVRRERGSFADPYANSIGVRLKLPFSSEARQSERRAGAEAELAAARAELAQLAQRLQLDVERARTELELAQAQLAAGVERRRLTADNLDLARQAYRLGETELAALLRVQAEAFQAERDAEKSRLAVIAARGRLNQTLGVQP